MKSFERRRLINTPPVASVPLDAEFPLDGMHPNVEGCPAIREALKRLVLEEAPTP
jgi:lysophospholipase L1-like esterase